MITHTANTHIGAFLQRLFADGISGSLGGFDVYVCVCDCRRWTGGADGYLCLYVDLESGSS